MPVCVIRTGDEMHVRKEHGPRPPAIVNPHTVKALRGGGPGRPESSRGPLSRISICAISLAAGASQCAQWCSRAVQPMVISDKEPRRTSLNPGRMWHVATVALGLMLHQSCQEAVPREMVVLSRPYSMDEMRTDADKFGMQGTDVERAAAIGLFHPADTDCEKRLRVAQPLDFAWFRPERDLSRPPELAIMSILSSLYRVFPDPNILQDGDADFDNMRIESVLDYVQVGIWAPQCAGISRTAARIINAYSADLHATVVETAYLDHTLNIISFEEDGQRFAIAADFQNGFLFPVKPVSGTFYSQDEMTGMSVEEGSFYWLPVHIQHSKRNLLGSVLPCNFLPDERERYHETPERSPYEFERLSFSFHKHLWFDLGMADIDSLRRELLGHLRDMRP